MKKFWTIAICAMLLGAVAFAAVGCNKGAGDTINVFSREDGSGTRSAFTELTGVLVEGEDGTETDMTFSGASFQNSTNAIMTAVAQDKNAIGYVSFGSLNETVKAVAVNGIVPSVDTIKDKSYELQRPFNIAYKQSNIDSKPLAADFLAFLGSAEAQEVIAAEKYIATDDNAPAYVKGSDLTGTITIGGSSSVSPLMEKLIEKYCDLSGVAKTSIELQTIDSTAGMNGAIEGTFDIGMASRDVKDTELSQGITAEVLAYDGIAVIVNNDNAVEDLTMEQIRQIFTGAVREWSRHCVIDRTEGLHLE